MNGLRIPLTLVNLALTRGAQRSNQTCKLYAVDNDVVWTPDR